MKVCSLSPAATAWIEAIGSGDQLTGDRDDADLIVAEDADAEGRETLVFAPQTLKQMVDAVLRLGLRLGRLNETMTVLAGLEKEIQAIHDRIGYTRGMDRSALPSVLCLERLEPPKAAVRWMPDVIEKAGGRLAVEADEPLDWEKIRRLAVDILVVVWPELDLEGAVRRLNACIASDPVAASAVASVSRVLVFDAPAYFSRPGPAIYEGIKSLAGVLHPGKLDTPAVSTDYRMLVPDLIGYRSRNADQGSVDDVQIID